MLKKEITYTSIFYQAGAFRVYDFDEEQIKSFLSFAETHPILESSEDRLDPTLGLCLGMCGIRHAAFMCDIHPTLLGFMFEQMSPGAIEREQERLDFHRGFLNVIEVLTKADKFQADPSFAVVIVRFVTQTLPEWQRKWPQPTEILHELNLDYLSKLFQNLPK